MNRVRMSLRFAKVCSTPGGTRTKVPGPATVSAPSTVKVSSPFEDVERIVLGGVEVRLRPVAVRLDRDDGEVEAWRVPAAREELDVANTVTFSGPNDDGSLRLRLHGCSILFP